MKIKINIGQSQLEFEGRDFKELAKEAGAFSQAQKCGLCNSKNIAIDYRSVKAKEGENAGKNFDYYSIKCLDCYASANLGQYQVGGWFLKKWEKFQSNNYTNNNKSIDNNNSDPFFDND